MTVSITLEKSRFYLRFPYNELDIIKAKNIPDRSWNKSAKAWTCRATLANVEYIEQAWGSAEWDEYAQEKRVLIYEKLAGRKATLAAKADGVDLSLLDTVAFNKPPMDHQKTGLLLGRDEEVFAYLMDQGTGKTKLLLDDASHNWREDRIDVLMVFTINSVKTNWVIFDSMKDEPEDTDAVEDHMPPDVPYVKGVWVSQQTGGVKKEWRAFEKAISEQTVKKDKLIILSANIESLRVSRAYDFYEQIIEAFGGRVMISVDESTLIGKPGSKQTKAAVKLRRLCSMARIMSGTPVIKSPMKAYSQFGFLDEDILGFGSFYSFRNHYCVMGGFEGRQILFYKNLPELNEKIASCSFRILKADCLELPPQEYLKRRVQMSAPQAKAYGEMQTDFITQNEASGRVEAKIVLEQRLRLQQITGGYLPIIDPETDKSIGVTPLIEPQNNPKFKEVLNILEEGGEQRMIVWARFTHEIEALVELLNDAGYPTLPFYGALSDKEKISVRKSFARDKKYRNIVGNPKAGGMGIDEFKYASLVAYVSTDPDTEKRVQSEDRNHRIGSEMHDLITYWDIICPNTVDIKNLQIMRGNAKVSAAVMGDAWREWI